MAEQFATSFSVLNYSGMLFNRGNTRTPLSSVIGVGIYGFLSNNKSVIKEEKQDE